MGELELEQSETNNLQKGGHEYSKRCQQDEKVRIGSSINAVSIQDASFAWSPAAGPVLQDINLEIPKQSIELLLGLVGSRKSTLIQGILGNARRVTGSLVMVPGSLSYCGQSPWLISGSVRGNITAGSAFDEEWYKYTLWTCSLDHDLQQLPSGDLTEVGSNGASLSGGQKQRVVSSTLSMLPCVADSWLTRL